MYKMRIILFLLFTHTFEGNNIKVFLFHYISYKYSFVMNITYVTMIYGAGLPILFPIALASFVLIYLTEVTLLYYIYRKPPMYDE